MSELFKENYNEGKVLILVILVDSVDGLQDSKQRQDLSSETENFLGERQ